MKPVKENGHNGAVIQVFVPTKREDVDTRSVAFGEIVRFSANGRYEFDSDGVKVPFTAGMTMGIPFGVTTMRLYDYETGGTLTTQIIEVM